MENNVESLVLEHLRALRGDMGLVKDDLATVKLRLGSVETQLSYVHA